MWKTSTLTRAMLASLLFPGLIASPVCHMEPTVDEATEFALIYGYPLLSYAKFALPILQSRGTNELSHMRQLSTADFQDVVRPNVDTLYSLAILDLSQRDLIIEVPEIPDRYWVFPFYDVYGNNYADIGSLSQSSSGKYRVRYSQDREPSVQLCGKAFGRDDECDDGYQGFINAPTPYGTFVGRLAVEDSITDLDKVHALQDTMALYPIPRKLPQPHHSDRFIPPLTIEMLNSSLPSHIPLRTMQMTARFTPFNPPCKMSDLRHVDDMLRHARIHHGHYKPPTGVNLTHLAQKASESVRTHAALPANTVQLRNNWSELAPSAQGNYGRDYKMRYYVAQWGYLALVASEALYPSYHDPLSDGGTTLTLGADQAYTITFASKPPLVPGGFWSVTAYNAEQYLVPNSLNRYALGDRSNITYADGLPVYGGSSVSEETSFQILVQPADLQPPRNWTSNWLPAPAGGGRMSITFRLYGPTQGLISGQWEYPQVRKHVALSA
ncbi:hypothetical protein BJX62DRAFT_242869 [Aspergillus germanicus]